MQRLLGLSGGPSIVGSLASSSREASSFCGPQRSSRDSTGLVQEEEKPGEDEASSLMDLDGLWEAHCYCRDPKGGRATAQIHGRQFFHGLERGWFQDDSSTLSLFA